MTSHYGGFWLRFFASIIDTIVMTIATSVVTLMGFGAVYWIGSRAIPFTESFDAVVLQKILFTIYSLLSTAYYVFGHYRYGTTLGKIAMRLYVVNAVDEKPITLRQAAIRALGYLVSALPFNAGYLVAAFHPKKRALHDLLAGTVVIKK